MNPQRTFKSYNFVTGAVDGTLAYDFSKPAYYPEEELYETPKKTAKQKEQIWIKEDVREKVQSAVHAKSGFSPIAMLGVICVVILLVLTLMAQIQLMGISGQSVAMENQIAELAAERDKLMVEYESVFNLKDVEEYAVGVLGMQEPRDDQIYYLTNVSSADKAVILTNDGSGLNSLGLEDLAASLQAYFS